MRKEEEKECGPWLPLICTLFYFKHVMSAKLGQTLECGDTSGHQVERLDFIVEIDALGSLSSRFFRNGERDRERDTET